MNISKKDKLIELDSIDISGEKYLIHLFHPTLFHLYPHSGNSHTMNFAQRMRFLQMYRHGYRVYLLTTIEKDFVAIAVFASGGLFRYPFATKNDLICGPYFVSPNYRNKGIAFHFLNYLMSNYEVKKDVFAHVWFENTFSIKCLTKLGFNKIGLYSTTKLTSRFFRTDNGKIIVYKRSVLNG